MIVGLANLSNTISNVFSNYELIEDISFSYSQKEEFDVQCNNLIKFSKHEDIKSIETDLSNSLEKEDLIESFEITDTHFINIRLSNSYLHTYAKFSPNYLSNNSESILIDYGGPNIGKALHVGHLRT